MGCGVEGHALRSDKMLDWVIDFDDWEPSLWSSKQVSSPASPTLINERKHDEQYAALSISKHIKRFGRLL